MEEEQSARFWQTASRRLARRINLGWWSEQWMAWVMSVGLLGSVALLLARWRLVMALPWVWTGIGGVLLFGAVMAWYFVRRHAESAGAARIRLEDALGLKARLTAAEAGVGRWPQPVEPLVWPVRWRWQRPLGVLAFASLMLTLATVVPVSRSGQDGKHKIEKPSAVKDVARWVEQLRKEKAVDEKSLDEVEKKIEDLLQRPQENWYEHGSLEAADNLKEQTAGELREMEQNLADAERAASALQAMGDAGPQAVKQSLADGLARASHGLESGGMKPMQQLLQDLQKAQSSDVGDLSPEQMKQMAQKLRENEQALRKALDESQVLDTSKIPVVKSGRSGRHGSSGEDGPDGDGDPGRGGANRGRGDAPLAFKEDATNLDTKKMEQARSQLDMSRIAPGDTLAVTNGEQEVDKDAYQGPKQGGDLQNHGDGGSAVWQNSLVPGEREALKRYFK